VKEGSSDYKKVRKGWFFKETLTEWFFVESKWFFYGIAVKNLLSTSRVFKQVRPGAGCINLATMLRLCLKFDQLAVPKG